MPAIIPPNLTLDVIIPVYNEEEALPAFHQQVLQAVDALPCRVRVLYVNDGSRDGTQAILAALAAQDERINAIELSRNFGHQAALTAGLERADADYVVTLDGDGQHPPALIQAMLVLALSGYDIVLTQRIEPESTGSFKRWSSDAFYRFINRIGETQVQPGAADFRLMSRAAVQGLRAMPEYHRFLRGMVAWVGFRSVILPFAPPARLAGESKYSLRKMVRLGMDAVFSFSLVPLYIAISVGIGFLVLAFVEMLYVLSFWISGNTARLAPGWSSLMFVLLVVGGSLMISLGLIGIYIGYIFQEVKRRPVYLVRSETPTHPAEPDSHA